MDTDLNRVNKANSAAYHEPSSELLAPAERTVFLKHNFTDFAAKVKQFLTTRGFNNKVKVPCKTT